VAQDALINKTNTDEAREGLPSPEIGNHLEALAKLQGEQNKLLAKHHLRVQLSLGIIIAKLAVIITMVSN